MAITAFRFGTAFSPLQLGPVVWLDASDGSTMFDATSGGSVVTSGDVYRIEDKSGNGNHFIQPVTANCPQKILNGRNGYSVLRFNNDWLYTTNNLNPQNFTIANHLTSNIDLAGLIGKSNGGVGIRNRTQSWNGSSNTSDFSKQGDTIVNYKYSSTHSLLPHIVSANKSNSSSYTTGGTSLGFYDYSLPTRYFVGDMYEIFGFSRQLDSFEINQLTRYLANKYNIT